MKTKIISLLVIIAIAVVSCQKDENDKPAKLQDVTFGIELVEFNDLKSTPECQADAQGNLLVPTVAEIVIGGIPYFIDVYLVEGKYYTQAFQLAVAGNPYSVTKFVLWTIKPVYSGDPLEVTNGAKIVMAMPEASSEYAQYLTAGSKTVPFNVTVGAFTKVEIPVEVLCFLPSVYDKFGFFWFDITEIVIREFCFFGDICANGPVWLPTHFIGSLYPTHIGGPPRVDMPAIFQIRVFGWEIIDDVSTRVPIPDAANNTFSSLGDPIKTVCAKFPDKIRTAGEAFEMELWVWIPVSAGPPVVFDWFKYATFAIAEDANGWTIKLGGVNALNQQFNAIDFAIGTCSPFSKWKWNYDGTLINP